MSKRRFAAILGIVFLAIGLAGFIPLLIWPPQGGALAMGSQHGLLLGLFPVNAMHNLAHLAFGAWGLAAARSPGGAVLYARGVAIAYAALTLMGFIPALDELFGLMPLYGNGIWLHLALAATAAYVGWVHRG